MYLSLFSKLTIIAILPAIGFFNNLDTNYTQYCKGLVLSGGGSFGSFQNGIVSNIINNTDNTDNYWDIISGVSSGSINAVYLSQFNKDHNLKQELYNMENLWSNLKTKDVYNNEYLLNELSLYDNTPLEKTINNLFYNTTIKNNIFVSSTSLANKKKTVWDKQSIQKNIKDIIMASTSIPFYFPPYYFQSQYFVDGAVSSNILLEETIGFCKENYPLSKIQLTIILSDSYNFNTDNTQEKNTIENVKDLTSYLENTIKNVIYYNQLSNIKLICESYKINIKLYERNGLNNIDYLDFNQGKKLWTHGFNLDYTKIVQVC